VRVPKRILALVIAGAAVGAGVGTVSSIAGAASKPPPQPPVVRAGGKTVHVGSVIGQAKRDGDNCDITDQLGAEVAIQEDTGASVEWAFDKDCQLVITKIETLSDPAGSSSGGPSGDGTSETPQEVGK